MIFMRVGRVKSVVINWTGNFLAIYFIVNSVLYT